MILTPAIGGLVVGLGLTYWVPAAAGSGIPQVEVAYTLRAGAISYEGDGREVCAVRAATSSGASLGLEGPTVQICAGVSSFLARMARLSRRTRSAWPPWAWRRALPRPFNAPIAAVTFTLEELIGSLDRPCFPA